MDPQRDPTASNNHEASIFRWLASIVDRHRRKLAPFVPLMVKSIDHCNTIANANWLEEELAEVEMLVLVDLHSAVVVDKMHHSVDVA